MVIVGIIKDVSENSSWQELTLFDRDSQELTTFSFLHLGGCDASVEDIEVFQLDFLPIQYHLGPKVSVGLRPIYSYNPRSLTVQNYAVDQRVSNFGIGLFTRFTL